ncbi:hypothetical protein QBC44DRAFT_368371 [Cladorrhinum sp. PSN332]|nr:hypothetical protein QBC44DRAFT_368371 [Cladorrhinum sp. PSN332]
MSGLPDPFNTSKETIIEARDWYSRLLENPGAYDKYVVRTLTHVKNLRSWVTIGRSNWGDIEAPPPKPSKSWFSSSSSSSESVGELPLPLWSLKLDSGVLKLDDLVQIHKLATDAGGKYSVLFTRHHCYWFAKKVYEHVRVQSTCKEEPWQWFKWRGKLKMFRPRDPPKPQANEFVEERKSRFEYAPGERDAFQVWLEAIYTDAARLSVDDETNVQEVVGQLVSDDLENGTTISSLTIPETEVSSESLSETMRNESEKILEHDAQDDDRYRGIYHDADLKKKVEVEGNYGEPPSIPEGIKFEELSEDEEKVVEDAVKVLVGYTLDNFK